MTDIKQVMFDIERCVCHVPDACRDCSHYPDKNGGPIGCMEDLLLEARELLKEQQPKTARWEKRTGMMPPEYHGHYWCSNCEWHGKYNEREKDYKFCPACGAEMENTTST